MREAAMVNGSPNQRAACRARVWMLGLGVVCGLMAFATPAHAYIYMSDVSDNTIARATLDGQHVDYTFIQGVSNPGQVVVDASHVYWFNRGDGAIGRANIDGSGVNPDFIPSAAAVGTGIAVGDGHIYWTDFQNSTLGEANIDGTGATTLVTGLLNPEGVAYQAGYVYWTNYGVENGSQVPIGRYKVDGTGGAPVNDFILAPSQQTGNIGQIIADAGHLYWGHGGNIARATIDGGNVNTAFAVAPGGNRGLAVSGSYFYWSTNGDYFSSQPIARANVDGTGVNPVFIDNHPTLGGIAVDGLAPPSPSPGPSPSPNPSPSPSGQLTVSINAPGSGTIGKLTGRGYTFRLTVSRACTASLKLVVSATVAKHSGLGKSAVTLVSTRSAVPQAGTFAATVIATKQYRNKLRRLRSIAATLSLACAGGGHTATVSRAITFRR